MTPPSMPSVWAGRAWRNQAEDWIRDAIHAAGLEPTGPIEQPRIRPWSTHLTVPTSGGLLWFKENHPAQVAEAAVVDELSRLAPQHVAVPLAVERTRGWLLTPDHGATLASLDRIDDDTWCRLVSEFADVQRRVAGAEEPLLAAGLQPLPPSAAADHVEHHVEQMRRRPPDDACYLPPGLADLVLRSLPSLRRTAGRLAAAGPALTSLEHNDLHQNNVFVPSSEEATLRYFDFGDAVWAHPFTSLMVPLTELCQDRGTEPDDPRVTRVVDAYLEIWTDVVSLPELREVARLARAMGPVHRFETWRRLLDGNQLEGHRQEAESVHYWLGRLARASQRAAPRSDAQTPPAT